MVSNTTFLMPSRSIMFSVMLPLRTAPRFVLDRVGESRDWREPRVDWDVGRDFEVEGAGRLFVGVSSFDLIGVEGSCSISETDWWPLLGVLGRLESGGVEPIVPYPPWRARTPSLASLPADWSKPAPTPPWGAAGAVDMERLLGVSAESWSFAVSGTKFPPPGFILTVL